MNTIQTYPNANIFLEDCQTFLEEQEAINNLILGLSLQMTQGADAESARFYAILNDQKGLVGCAIQTSADRNILIASKEEDFESLLEAMANMIEAENIRFPGVLGPKKLAHCLAEVCAQHYGLVAPKLVFDQGVYRLDALILLPKIASGRFRFAQKTDRASILPMFKAFSVEALGEDISDEEAEKPIAALESKGALAVWEDEGIIVSIAAFGRQTKNGVSVSHVYTPPEYRRKGYASSCVFQLSEYLLSQDFAFCTLFTDLANPISNSIYQKMGYRQVADFATYVFPATELKIR